ncbi:DUF2570 family protein [Aggregatibacter kilianii]|uniref:DUF2570 family protein n=1 Tax=Aggregatibacter kilianii TaxID=2025884 RepID=UPI001EF7AFF0|nr:DUF2570 family protein [Aggregatibacter kilianii]
MFNRPIETIKTYLIGALAAVVLGLGVWSRYQHSNIVDLKAENQAQAQTIEQQESDITALKKEALDNQRILLELSQREAEARSEADDVIKSIPQDVKKSNPYNSVGPRGVIEFLRK